MDSDQEFICTARLFIYIMNKGPMNDSGENLNILDFASLIQ